MLMDFTFFLTVVAAAIGFFTLFGAAIGFFKLFENKNLASSSSSSPPSSLCLSSSSSSLSSSSSSSPSSSLTTSSCKWTHDVFPSFRGEDVRRNFFSHIHKEFYRKGITLFIDNDIKRGESIGPELVQAIRTSKVAVVLLSRNYVSSKWCLDELVEIMKCKEELGQMVFAIFYEVDPSDVKKLTGDFGSVFKKTCAGQTKEDVERWRQALAKLATIAGFHSSNWDNEALMVEDIVGEISKRLINSAPSSNFEGFIGMERHMENMKLLLCLGSDEVRMIGIWGPPGIGKTTIARFTYHQISGGFQLSVFMKMEPSYGRPTCSDDHDVKLYLEQQLLSQLTNQKDLEISDLGAVETFLSDKKVLVVLDGVDQLVQLLAMPKPQCLGPGTRIIITTQNHKLLKAFEIEHIYKVDLPPDDEALQIFCMNAFGQNSPYDGFEDLAWEVTTLAGSLPLGLKVIGSHLRGMSKEDWEEELPRLRICLDGEIGSILKFSYDALGEEDKDLFLCIACFFNLDEDLNDSTFEDILRHRFSNVRRGLKVLVERALLSSEKYYSMHNLLVQLGREIVRKQSINDPGKRQFLVDAKEIGDVLTENTGSRSVIGINTDIYMIEEEFNISERAFEEMSDLQFLKICNSGELHLPQGLTYLPPKLRVLHWYNYPMTCLPSTFNPKFLVKIVLTYSKLEKLWERIQPLRNLKLMDLDNSANLKELPDLSTATKLERIKLSGCLSLVELPNSIGNVTSLQELSIDGCSSLLKLPSSFKNLTYLWKLNLRECTNLLEVPSIIGDLTNLRQLKHMWSSEAMIPNYMANPTNYPELHLNKCLRLRKLPSSIGNLTSLPQLSLSGCSDLVELPSSIGNLTNLRRLVLTDCSSLVELPSSIGNLTNLQSLDLERCSSLVKIPSSIGNLQMLKRLDWQRCSKLEVLPVNINLGSLISLNVTGCSQLTSFPEISTNIERLQLCGTLVNEVPLSVKSWSRLKDVHIPYCKNLGEFSNVLDNITELEFINLEIEELPSWISGCYRLKGLVLNNCRKLVSIPHLSKYTYRKLTFANCWQLNEEAKNIIIQSSSFPFTAILPGREVPAFFTYRATNGGSLTVKLNGRCLPKSLRFKVCILLVHKGEEGACDEKDAWIFCKIWCKQSGHDFLRGRSKHDLDLLLKEHLYTFEVEADKVESNEVSFEFELKSDKWEIAECGARELEEEDTLVADSVMV